MNAPTFAQLGGTETGSGPVGRRIYTWKAPGETKARAWVGVDARTAQGKPYGYLVANGDPAEKCPMVLAETFYGVDHEVKMRQFIADLHTLAEMPTASTVRVAGRFCDLNPVSQEHAVDWMRGKVTLTVCVDPSDVASLVRMGASVVVEVQT